MREIIHIQVGGCGNRIGTKFWETIAAEHGLDNRGNTQRDSYMERSGLHVYFNETVKGHYVPRTALVDLDPASEDSVRSGPLGRLFAPQSFISGKASTGNNWAKGFYTEGAALCDPILDLLRKEAECCDQLQGFQLSHSLCGGTGGALGSLISNKLYEHYPQLIFQTFSLFPSVNGSQQVVEPYNTCFSLDKLKEHINIMHSFDNSALRDICLRSLGLAAPTWEDMNTVISRVISDVSCSLRFPGPLNSNLRKLATNLVPRANLHYCVSSIAPIPQPQRPSGPEKPDVEGLMRSLFDPTHMLSFINPLHGRYITVATIFRGAVETGEVDKHLHRYFKDNTSSFACWVSDCLHSAVCRTGGYGGSTQATLIANCTSLQEPLKVIDEGFTRMYKRKAFMYSYLAEGMDEIEFTQAESSLNDIISDCQWFQDYVPEEEGEYDDPPAA